MYLKRELHEFRYRAYEPLLSHKVEEGQQELMAGLAREEEENRFNIYFYTHK